MHIQGRRNKTVSLIPYGTMPIQDAKETVRFPLSASSLKKGKRNTPDGCVVSLEIKKRVTPLRERDIQSGILESNLFPGHVLGAWTYKTFTLVATTIGKRIQALRYTHPAWLTKAINGFDKRKSGSFNVGQTIELLAPKGIRQLGTKRNPTDRPRQAVVQHRKTYKCIKRGCFVDDLHTRLAAQQLKDSIDTVV